MVSSKSLLKEKRSAEARGNLRAVGTLCNELGGLLQEEGDLLGALQQHQQELHACEALTDALGMGVAHRRLGEVLCELGKPDEALQHHRQHLQLARDAGSLLEQQRALATIGKTQLDRADRETEDEQEKKKALAGAQNAFLNSVAKCKELQGVVGSEELSQMRCRLYLNLGLVADQTGDTDQAIKFIHHATSLIKNSVFHEDLFRCYIALGEVYLRLKRISLALEEGRQAELLCGKLHSCSKKADVHEFLSRVNLYAGDYKQATKHSCKAYKFLKSAKGDHSLLKTRLKKMSNLYHQVSLNVKELDVEDKLKHFEKLGDLCAQLGCFDQAIEYYQQILDCATAAGKSELELAPIYYSIAQTYDDDNKLKEAKEYYYKEYKIRLEKDTKEACKTLLCIAEVAFRLKETVGNVEKYYEDALKLAEGESPKMQIYVLKSHASLEGISTERKEELKLKIETISDVNNFGSDCELTDQEEESSTDSDTDLDLLEFSDSDEELAVNNSNQTTLSNVIRVKDSLKVNQFGESQLHRACIAGDLHKVKSLIQGGHGVNVRDKAGWLPLHEACNHGFVEVVEYLLSVGAWINDRGGSECSSITPLHDSASCGHLDIVQLLLKKGASVISKNADGQTPLDSLVDYKQRSHFCQLELEEIEMVENKLRASMARMGHPQSVNPSTTKNTRRETCETKTSSTQRCSTVLDDVERSLHRLNNYNSDDSTSENESPIKSVLSPVKKKKAVMSYQSAISSLGSAVSRKKEGLPCSVSSSVRPATKKAKTGLISAEEFVGEDDWLEMDTDDLISRKRKRPVLSLLEFATSNKERKIAVKDKTNKITRTALQRTKQPKMTSIFPRQPSSTFVASYSDDGEDITWNDDILTDSSRPELTTIEPALTTAQKRSEPRFTKRASNDRIASTSPNTISSSDTSNTIVPGGTLRLRVKVEDKMLLVPISEACRDCTIEWLTGEVSRRYYQLIGIKPQITLKTSDGAILHPTDPITLVLSAEREELIASVSGWDLPPLDQRYTQECRHFNQPPVPAIAAALTQADSSASLDLRKIATNSTQLKPVIRAIQRHQNLHSVCLAYTRLCDEGFMLLLDAMPSLPGLSVLNLQASSITNRATAEWALRIDKGGFKSSSLTNIDISYNYLYGCTLAILASLLSIPNLTTLNAKHCYLQIEQLSLMNQYPSMHILKLDYNTIHPSPLKQLLSNLPALKHLSLCGLICPTDGTNNIASALSNLLGGIKECTLEHLGLSFANLSAFELDNITPFLYRCSSLNHLGLAHNTLLTEESLNVILTELTTNLNFPLVSLELHGIKSVASEAFTQSLVQMLQHKYNIHKPLQALSINTGLSSELIITTFKALYKEKSKVRLAGGELFLSVAN